MAVRYGHEWTELQEEKQGINSKYAYNYDIPNFL
jgi:hypothetical protein